MGSSLERTCTVIHSKADADFHIVKAAVESAKTKTTVEIGEDTDLLTLLAHHFNPGRKKIIFTSDTDGKGNMRWLLRTLVGFL